MQRLIKGYTTKTQEVAKFHGIYDKETLKIIESLIEKYPKIYTFLMSYNNIEIAISEYLKKYHSKFSDDFDSFAFFIDEKEKNARKLLGLACEILGIALVTILARKITARPAKIEYPHKDTWMLTEERQKDPQEALEKDLNLSPRRK